MLGSEQWPYLKCLHFFVDIFYPILNISVSGGRASQELTNPNVLTSWKENLIKCINAKDKRGWLNAKFIFCILRCLHFLDRFKTQNWEAGSEDTGGGLAQKDPGPVDLDDVPGLVLLHAVTLLVELCEGVGNLVHKLTKGVEKEILGHPLQNLSEPEEEKN